MPGAGALLATAGQAAIGFLGSPTVGKILLSTAANYAINSLASELKDDRQPRQFDRSINGQFRDPSDSRKIVYGKIRKSGTVAFWHDQSKELNDLSSTGASHFVGKSKGDDVKANEYRHYIILLAGHSCDKILEPVIDGNEIADNEYDDATGDIISGTYSDIVRFVPHLGSDSQSADPDLKYATDKWTDSHRLRGITYVYFQAKWDRNVWDDQPKFAVQMRGKDDIYDPRDGNNKYTHNSALCTADYLTDDRLGMGRDWSKINESALIEAANICEEQVSDNAGGQHDRYACNGVIDTGAKPERNLQKLTGSMMGSVEYTNGQYHIRAGAHRTAQVTFTESDARGEIEIQTSQSRREKFNKVTGEFINPQNDWQPSDIPAIKLQKYVDEDNGNIKEKDMKFDMTTSQQRAMRLGKVGLFRNRFDETVKFPARLNAMQFLVGDTLRLDLDRYNNINDKLYRVVEWEFVIDESGEAPVLGVDLLLKESDPLIYQDKFGYGELGYGEYGYGGFVGENAVPSPNVNISNPNQVGAPTNLNASSSGRAVVQSDGTVISKVVVDWDLPNNKFIESGGRFEIQYKKSSNNNWADTLFSDAQSTKKPIENLEINVDYDFRVRVFSASDGVSAWTTITNHTISGDSTAPDPPENVTANQTWHRTNVLVEWDPPTNKAPDLNEYTVYRNTTNDFSTATALNQTDSTSYLDSDMTQTQAKNKTVFYYWITAEDGSENESAASPSANVTLKRIPDDAANTNPPQIPDAPTKISESVYQSTSDGTTYALFEIDVPQMKTDARRQIVSVKNTDVNNPEWQRKRQTENDSGSVTVDIDELTPGRNYDVGVAALGAYGQVSNYNTIGTFLAPGDTTAPSQPSNFTAKVNQNTVVFQWDANTEDDLDGYQAKIIPSNSTRTWSDGRELFNAKKDETEKIVQVRQGKFNVLLSAFDYAGNRSVSAELTINNEDSDFITARKNNVLAINNPNESNPPSSPYGVGIHDDIAFIAYGFDGYGTQGGVASVDISDTSNLSQLGFTENISDLGGSGIGVDVTNDPTEPIFYTTGYKGIASFSLSDPSNPTQLDFLGTNDYEISEIIGNIVYAADLSTSTLYAIDISDPSNLSQVDSLTVPNGQDNRVLATSGNYIYTAGFSADLDPDVGRISIINAFDGNNMTLVNQSGQFTELRDPNKSTVYKGYFYIVEDGDNALYTFSVQNPNNITLENTYSFAEDITEGGGELRNKSDELYYIDNDNNHFYTFDVSSPSNPTLIDKYSDTDHNNTYGLQLKKQFGYSVAENRLVITG